MADRSHRASSGAPERTLISRSWGELLPALAAGAGPRTCWAAEPTMAGVCRSVACFNVQDRPERHSADRQGSVRCLVVLAVHCLVPVSVERIKVDEITKPPLQEPAVPWLQQPSYPFAHQNATCLSTPQPWHPRLQSLLPSPAWRCQRCVWDFSKSCKKLGSSFSFCMSLSAAKNFCPGTGNLVLSRAVGSRQ